MAPLNGQGRFPATGIAFQLISVASNAAASRAPDTSLPIHASSFRRYHGYLDRASTLRGVPRPISRSIRAGRYVWEADVFIGPKAARPQQAELRSVMIR